MLLIWVGNNTTKDLQTPVSRVLENICTCLELSVIISHHLYCFNSLYTHITYVFVFPRLYNNFMMPFVMLIRRRRHLDDTTLFVVPKGVILKRENRITEPYIRCPYPCPCPPMPMGFGWAWVRCYCSWVGTGGHRFCASLHPSPKRSQTSRMQGIR